MGWMTSFNRKKHQRRINKYMREINKNIYNDDLWRGRFEVRQAGTPYFHVYEDRSGADLENVHLVVIDKATGDIYEDWDSGNSWCYFNGSKIWSFVNKAITEYFDVWRKGKDPRKLKDDPAYDFRRKK